MGILISGTLQQESQESILFCPVLKAYPTHHSWIITTPISLGDLDKQWRMFIQQKARSNQLLTSLQWKPLAPSYLLSTLQVELANLDSIYTLYKPFILTATQLLKNEPSFNDMSPLGKCIKRSLLPFLGDAISWLTGTATTKDIRDIKKRVNQLISTQAQQQETLVHVILILNVTRYVTKVTRQFISAVMAAVQRTHNNFTKLFNIMSSIYTSINYQQIHLHICSILANLRDSLYYMRQIAMHTLDYIDAATTSILMPHVLPVEYLWEILMHIKAELPSTMHLPVSSDDTLHFYRYLCTHILVAEEQFLLLIWCTYSASYTTTQDLPSLQPIHT